MYEDTDDIDILSYHSSLCIGECFPSCMRGSRVCVCVFERERVTGREGEREVCGHLFNVAKIFRQTRIWGKINGNVIQEDLFVFFFFM